jgi:hypothetical protein
MNIIFGGEVFIILVMVSRRQKDLAVTGVVSTLLTIEAFITDIQSLVTATADVRPSCHPYQQQR